MNNFDYIVNTILNEVMVTAQSPTFPKGPSGQDVMGGESGGVQSRGTIVALRRKSNKTLKSTNSSKSIRNVKDVVVPPNHNTDTQRGS